MAYRRIASGGWIANISQQPDTRDNQSGEHCESSNFRLPGIGTADPWVNIPRSAQPPYMIVGITRIVIPETSFASFESNKGAPSMAAESFYNRLPQPSFTKCLSRIVNNRNCVNLSPRIRAVGM